MSELLPKPTAEAVKAYSDEHEVGMYEAKRDLHDNWVRENMLAIANELRSIKGAAQAAHPSVPQLAAAMEKLVDLILDEMEHV